MNLRVNKIKLNFSSTPSFLVFFTAILSLFVFFSPLVILAADPVVTTLDGGISATADSGCSWSSGSGKGKYCLLAPISAFEGVSDGKLDIQGGGIEIYLQNLYKFGVYIAIGLAVMMIVIGGMQYVSTDAVSGKDDGKKRITSALQGLILALMAYLILQVVNPELLKTSNLKPKTSVSLSGSMGTNPGTFGQTSGLTPVTSTTNPSSNSSAKPTIEGQDYGDTSINTSITNLNNYESQIKALQEQAKTANDTQKAQLESQKQAIDAQMSVEMNNITSKGGTLSRTSSGEWVYSKTTASGGTTSGGNSGGGSTNGGSGNTGGSSGNGLPSGNGDVTQTTNPLLPPVN